MWMHLSHYGKISSDIVHKTGESEVQLQCVILLSQGLFTVVVCLAIFNSTTDEEFSHFPRKTESPLGPHMDNIALFSIMFAGCHRSFKCTAELSSNVV